VKILVFLIGYRINSFSETIVYTMVLFSNIANIMVLFNNIVNKDGPPQIAISKIWSKFIIFFQ
jgi:hypothetical protein